MIQVSKRSLHDNSILTCRIHDLLRDIAIEKAKETNFVTIFEKQDGKQDLCGARRVAFHNLNYRNVNEVMKCASPNLRTLLCFNSELPDFSGHRRIKVLHVPAEEIAFTTCITIRELERLSQLRYLKLGENILVLDEGYFNKLIYDMKFLQTLHIESNSLMSCDQIIDCICHIETLRHVIIPMPRKCPLFAHPQSIVLQNLQTLICCLSQPLKTIIFPNLPNLRRFHIYVRRDDSWGTILAFLQTLKNLVELGIEGDYIPIEILDTEGYSFYQHLTSLSYKGPFSANNGETYTFGKLISFRTTMFPIHLTKLTFDNSGLCQDHIDVLEKLPELKELEICNTNDHLIGYFDNTIECSAEGFQHLAVLKFSCLSDLKVLKIKKGAMPKLKKLTVDKCYKIQMPLGIQHLTTLRDLTWVQSGRFDATSFIEDVCKHVPAVTFRSKLLNSN